MLSRTYIYVSIRVYGHLGTVLKFSVDASGNGEKEREKGEKPASKEPLVMIRPLTLTPLAGRRACGSGQMESFDTREPGRARHDLCFSLSASYL